MLSVKTGPRASSCVMQADPFEELLLYHQFSGSSAFTFPAVSMTDKVYSSDAFFETLMSIHDAGVLHGDLRLDNLLVKDTKDVTIIDFDRAVLHADDAKKEEEFQSLLELLEGEVKETVTEQKKSERHTKSRMIRKTNIKVSHTIPAASTSGGPKVVSNGMVLRPRLPPRQR